MVNFILKIFEYMLFELALVSVEAILQFGIIISWFQKILFGPKPEADERTVMEIKNGIFGMRELIENYFGVKAANRWAKRKEKQLNKNGVPIILHLED